MPDGVVVVHSSWVGREIDNESDSVDWQPRGTIFPPVGTMFSSYLGDHVGGGQSVANLSGAEWIFARERFRTALAAADLDALNSVEAQSLDCHKSLKAIVISKQGICSITSSCLQMHSACRL